MAKKKRNFLTISSLKNSNQQERKPTEMLIISKHYERISVGKKK